MMPVENCDKKDVPHYCINCMNGVWEGGYEPHKYNPDYSVLWGCRQAPVDFVTGLEVVP